MIFKINYKKYASFLMKIKFVLVILDGCKNTTIALRSHDCKFAVFFPPQDY